MGGFVHFFVSVLLGYDDLLCGTVIDVTVVVFILFFVLDVVALGFLG